MARPLTEEVYKNPFTFEKFIGVQKSKEIFDWKVYEFMGNFGDRLFVPVSNYFLNEYYDKHPEGKENDQRLINEIVASINSFDDLFIENEEMDYTSEDLEELKKIYLDKWAEYSKAMREKFNSRYQKVMNRETREYKNLFVTGNLLGVNCVSTEEDSVEIQLIFNGQQGDFIFVYVRWDRDIEIVHEKPLRYFSEKQNHIDQAIIQCSKSKNKLFISNLMFDYADDKKVDAFKKEMKKVYLTKFWNERSEWMIRWLFGRKSIE